MRGAYPVVISKSEESYLVTIPDLDIDSEADSIISAIDLARSKIVAEIINRGDNIPEMFRIDRITGVGNDIVTLVDFEI